MTNFKPSMVIGVALAFVGSLAIQGVEAQQAGPTQSEMALALNKINENYKNFNAIEHLKLKFGLKYELFQGRRRFAFDKVEVATYRSGKKMRLEFLGRESTKETKQIYAWNGKTSTSLVHFTKDLGSDYVVRKSPDVQLYYFNYYVEFLGYPEAAASALTAMRKGTPKGIPYLPNSLLANAKSLSGLPDEKGSEGATCKVIINPGVEKLWLDPDLNWAIRRRDIYDPASKQLSVSTSYQKFHQTGMLWVPELMVRDEFGAPEKNADPPLLSRKTVRINELSTQPLADGLFLLEAPQDVKVHDTSRRIFYTHIKPGTNQVVESAEKAKTEITPTYPVSPWQLVLIVGTIVVLLILTVIVIMGIRK